TSVELALLPLARAGLLSGPLEVVGVTGSSGSGAVPSATTHHPLRAGNLRTYKPLEHQHTPEIEETLRAAGATPLELGFVPVSAPLVRGIFPTASASVPGEIAADRLRALYDEQYAREPFTRVPQLRLPEVVAVAGSNYAEVAVARGAFGDGRTALVCFAALDN